MSGTANIFFAGLPPANEELGGEGIDDASLMPVETGLREDTCKLLAVADSARSCVVARGLRLCFSR